MGILQARILEWVAMSSSRGSSRPRNRTQVSCTAGRFFTVSVTREAQTPPPRLQLKIQQAESKTWYNQINKNKNNFFKEVPNSYFLKRERHTDEKKVWEQSGGGRRGHSRQKLLFLQMGGLMPRAWQAAAKACRDWQRALLRPPNSQRLSVHLTKKGLRITRLAHLAQPGV